MHSAKNLKIYNHGLNYEIFLTRAFKSYQRIKRAKKQEFINLANCEERIESHFLPPFSMQVKEVKRRLKTALKILIVKSENEQQRRLLEVLEEKTANIKSYRDVIEIINIGLAATN